MILKIGKFEILPLVGKKEVLNRLIKEELNNIYQEEKERTDKLYKEMFARVLKGPEEV